MFSKEKELTVYYMVRLLLVWATPQESINLVGSKRALCSPIESADTVWQPCCKWLTRYYTIEKIVSK